jgi:6-phosphogluconolactonase (cycloisomerase 2 family)
MRKLPKTMVWAALALMSCFAAIATAFAAPPYIITNDDAGFPFTGVSFYAVGPNGGLTYRQQVTTVGTGIAGGFFGANRIRVLSNANQSCVFASEAATHDVVGIDINTLTLGGSASASDTDDGSGNGIGLAVNDQYLYAGFAESNTIGTFHVLAGCGLTYINSIAVGGLDAGSINGLAVHGRILIATYTDGTIESFDITNGTPLSHGDKQLSSGTNRARGATFPNSIDITSDGHFAIFGDTSTSLVVEVSDLSSGKLGKTTVYSSTASISSSNVILSPDESLLYVVNTQGATVTVLFFDKATGKLAAGCTSDTIRGHSTNWSYLAGVALGSNTGDGDGVYVAEFPSGIARLKLKLKGKTCEMHEAVQSPFKTKNAAGLLSIGAYPPRAF